MNKPILVFIFTIFISGCASVEKDWQIAMEQNNEPSYIEFLKEHPESIYSTKAKEKIYNIRIHNAAKPDWEIASKANSIALYKRLIENHPETRFANEAIQAIDDIRWQQADNMHTIESYTVYLNDLPNGIKRDVAKSRIKTLTDEFKAAEVKRKARSQNIWSAAGNEDLERLTYYINKGGDKTVNSLGKPEGFSPYIGESPLYIYLVYAQGPLLALFSDLQ